MEEGMKPEGEEGKGIAASRDEGGREAGSVRGTGGVAAEVALPGGDDLLAGGGVVNMGGAKGGGGEETISLGRESVGFEVGVGRGGEEAKEEGFGMRSGG